VLVAGLEGHLQARLPDQAGCTGGLGGFLGLQVAGVGVEQFQVLVPAGGALEDLGVEGGAGREAGQVGGQLHRVLGQQAAHRPGRPVDGEAHAASPPGAARRARRALAAASASCAK
jgi:hypothetical protein